MQPLTWNEWIRIPTGLFTGGPCVRQTAWAPRESLMRWLLVALVSFAGLFTGSHTASAQPNANFAPVSEADVFQIIASKNELTLTERFSRVLELDQRITRVDGFDPAIITVSALTPHRIRLQAVAPGVTTLILVDEFDRNYSIEVFVEGDVRHLQSHISRLFPDSSVIAMKVKDSVVLRGVVADPSHISQITEVAEQFYPKVINHMQFGAANQVRLQVKIVEAQRSRIRQLGFNWSFLSGNGYISSNPGSLAVPGSATLTPGAAPGLDYGAAGLADSAISFGVVNANSVFRGFLEALKQEGLLRILVETSVVADSGRPASLLSGGEFPILVPQALGTLSVEWREFGVRLEAVPIVLGQGQVLLEIAPEFSERDFANAATLNNTTIPAITTRRANTQVRMRLGQTLMIGGLIATRYTAETDKLPFLGELPGIGAAFRRVRYDENETELIILVTPEYVAPLNPQQVPDGGPGMFSDIPTDRELMWQGLIEIPNYGGPVPPSAYGPGEFSPMTPGMSGPAVNGPIINSNPVIPEQNLQLTPVPEQTPPPYGPEDLIPLPEPMTLPETSSTNPTIKQNLPSTTVPMLPVIPAPPSKPPVNSISNQVTSAGRWQQSGQSSQVVTTGAEQQFVNPTVTHSSTVKQPEGQWKIEDLDMEPPSLIKPQIQLKNSAEEWSAPQP